MKRSFSKTAALKLGHIFDCWEPSLTKKTRLNGRPTNWHLHQSCTHASEMVDCKYFLDRWQPGIGCRGEWSVGSFELQYYRKKGSCCRSSQKWECCPIGVTSLVVWEWGKKQYLVGVNGTVKCTYHYILAGDKPIAQLLNRVIEVQILDVHWY